MIVKERFNVSLSFTARRPSLKTLDRSFTNYIIIWPRKKQNLTSLWLILTSRSKKNHFNFILEFIITLWMNKNMHEDLSCYFKLSLQARWELRSKFAVSIRSARDGVNICLVFLKENWTLKSSLSYLNEYLK